MATIVWKKESLKAAKWQPILGRLKRTKVGLRAAKWQPMLGQRKKS